MSAPAKGHATLPSSTAGIAMRCLLLYSTACTGRIKAGQTAAEPVCTMILTPSRKAHARPPDAFVHLSPMATKKQKTFCARQLNAHLPKRRGGHVNRQHVLLAPRSTCSKIGIDHQQQTLQILAGIIDHASTSHSEESTGCTLNNLCDTSKGFSLGWAKPELLV